LATKSNQKLAVLIDADNAQAFVIQELLAEVSRYGTATIKRAYGDWTTTNLRAGKRCCTPWPSSPCSSSVTPAAKTPPIRL
jgi:hypothetical protein